MDALLYKWDTARGTVFIRAMPNGRYHVIFNDKSLGSYHSARAAADDVAGGHTLLPANGVEFSLLDISPDIGDWERVKVH